MIDSKWKEHLHSLDDLKEGIGLRAYGQRDPKIEYKKEAFDLFQAMVDTIKDEAVEFLFRIQAVREEKMESSMTSRAQFLHPESGGMPEAQAAKPAAPRQAPRVVAPGADIMTQEPAEPAKRGEPKVGRNDPCPCGSGKKYKKCHGTDE
jgi:preprotein translocase subunit SecA